MEGLKYYTTDLGDVSDNYNPDGEMTQMRLIEQRQLNEYPFASHIVISLAVIKKADWYSVHAPDALNNAVEFVNFWGALAGAQPPSDNHDQNTV